MDKPFAEAHFQVIYEPYRKFFRAGTKGAALFSYIVASLGLAIDLVAGIILGFDFVLTLLCLVLATVLLLRFYLDWVLPRSFYQKAHTIFSAGVTVKLGEQSFEALTEDGKGSAMPYDKLVKAIETDDGFLLHTPGQVLIVPKDTLSEDSRLKLREILQEKLSVRFTLQVGKR